MPSQELRLFGIPRIEEDGVEIAFGRRKALALLAYLAVMQQPQSRDRLLALLWPDFDPSSARNNLRRELSLLNALFGADLVHADRTSVSLVGNLRVDASDFRHAVRLGGAERSIPSLTDAAVANLLGTAVTLYQDDFMVGFALQGCAEFEEWQLFERESLRRQLGHALAALVQWNERQGEQAWAIDYARRWVALDPLHEPAQRTLMRAYALAGEQAAALRQYETIVALIKAELGGTVEAETDALRATIQARQLTAATNTMTHLDRVAGTPTVRPGTKSTDAGIPAATTSILATTPSDAAVRLPYATTSFVGRSTEVAGVTDLLRHGGCRLLSLLGPGGSGKTRLAVEAARAASEHFPDGVTFVSLHLLTSGDQIAGAIADSLGLIIAGHQDAESALASFLRHQRALIVLDNLEQVLDSAEVLSRLLSATEFLKCLGTTREVLNLAEEWIYPVEGLELPTPASEFDHAAQTDAVKLFVERARRVQRNLDVAGELPHIVQICRLVDGLPLALELAAAWTKTLTCAEIAEAVQRDIDFLAGTARNIPDRHRSMRAVLDASWRRLTPAETTIFQALSVFLGGFRQDSALEVARATWEHLTAFMDKSMLQRASDGRYTMHEIVRHYAAEHLTQSPEQLAAVEAAHTDFFLTLLNTLQPEIKGGNQRLAVDLIDAEYANARIAFQRRLKEPGPGGLELAADTLYYYLEIGSHFVEGADLMREGIQALQSSENTPAQAALLGQLSCYAGWFLLRLGELDQVAAAFHAAQHYYTAANVSHVTLTGADPLTGLGTLANTRGEYAAAERLGDEARQRCEAAGDLGNLADACYVLINACYAQGQYQAALRYAYRARALLAEIGDRWMMGYVLTTLGMITRALGDYGQARQHFQMLLALREEFGDREGTATALRMLADIALREEAYGDAAALNGQSLAILRRLHDRGGLAAALVGLAEAEWIMGQKVQAAGRYVEALRIAREIEYLPMTLRTVAQLGSHFLDEGQTGRGTLLLAISIYHGASTQEVKDYAQQILERHQVILTQEHVAAALRSCDPDTLDDLLADLIGLLQGLAEQAGPAP